MKNPITHIANHFQFAIANNYLISYLLIDLNNFIDFSQLILIESLIDFILSHH